MKFGKLCEKLSRKFKRIFSKRRNIYISAWIDGDNYGDDYLANSVYSYLKANYDKENVCLVNLSLPMAKINNNDIVIIAGGG